MMLAAMSTSLWQLLYIRRCIQCHVGMRWTFGVSDYTCIQILAQPFISQLWHKLFLRGTHYFYEGFTLADYFYEALIISTRDLHSLFLRGTHHFYEALSISKLMLASIHTQLWHKLFLRGIYFSRYQEARSPSVLYLAGNHIVVT